MKKELASGVALIAIAGIYYMWSNQIADSTLSDEIGAGGLPHLLSIILAGLGALLVGKTLLTARLGTAGASDADEDENNGRFLRALGFLLFGAAYVLLLPFIGYIAGVALLIGAVALYEGAPRNWVVPAAAIGGGVLYWALFVKLLGVNEPMGSIFQGLF